jgi:hypothetical protein
VVVEAVPIPGAGQTLIGNNANNTLNGGNNNDTLQPLGGADSLNGGAGSDTVIFTPQFRLDTITLASGSFGAQNNSHLVAVGDVNNDGLMDFAMRTENTLGTAAAFIRRGYSVNIHGHHHSPYADLQQQTFNTGHVYLVYGSSNGIGALDLSTTHGVSGPNNGYISLTSTASAGEGFGQGLGSLGDFDGDGKSDFLVSARGADSMSYTIGDRYWYDNAQVSSDSWSLSNEGRVYLFSGGNEALVNRESGAVNQTTLSASGSAVTAQANVLPTGAVSNYWNSIDGSTYTPQNSWEVPGVNTTYTYTTSATTADAVYKGSTNNAQFGSGWAPVSLGDLNADGFDDFMSGTGGQVYFGRAQTTSGFNLAAADFAASRSLGSVGRIAALGDVDGDGYQDFMVSRTDTSVDASNFIVYGSANAASWTAPTSWISSAASGTTPGLTLLVPESGFKINGTYSALGDINGDGFDDILISANGPSNDPNDFNAKDNGGLYVVFGQAGRWNNGDINLAGLAAAQKGFRITGAVDFDDAGEYSWTGVGDMNGDGLDDFILQAPGDAEADNAGTTNLGSSYLMFGRERGWQDISLMEMQDYGIQLLRTDNGYWTKLGDVDGDGFDDVALTQSTSMKIFYGGDYLTSGSNMAVQVVKVAEGETLTANAAKTAANPTGADRLIGNVGNDTLVGDGGRDVLIGGAGDDLIKVAFEAPIAGDSVADAADGVRDSSVFFKIDGGTGIDTVEFTSAMGAANTPFSLSGLNNGTIENIEVLRLGQGNQSISLDRFDVLSMTGSTNTAIDDVAYQKGNTLVIQSTNGSDKVTLTGGGWSDTNVNVSVGGQGSFSVYQHSGNNIHVVIDDNILRAMTS